MTYVGRFSSGYETKKTINLVTYSLCGNGSLNLHHIQYHKQLYRAPNKSGIRIGPQSIWSREMKFIVWKSAVNQSMQSIWNHWRKNVSTIAVCFVRRGYLSGCIIILGPSST